MTAQERILLEDVFGLSLTDICSGAIEKLSTSEKKTLEALKLRLDAGEPVQYVTGKALFCNHYFHVEPGVLIPRPETEELVEKIASTTGNHAQGLKILDIGTGSGCIAISLALYGADVTAWDISDKALEIARGNARELNAQVTFQKTDILNFKPEYDILWDVIVSNPPYICHKEAEDMENNVLDYEPHEALFVPDEKPLLFYDAISDYAVKSLQPDGLLAFEINPLYAKPLQESLLKMGFRDVAIHNDSYGKERFIISRK